MQLELDESGDVRGEKTGTWTPFYDQAFRVDLDDGTSFIANYRYALKEYVDNDPRKHGLMHLADVQSDDYDKFYSVCDKTMVGFVYSTTGSMSNHPAQCFFGVK